MGIGPVDGLSIAEVDELERIATVTQRRGGWRSPPAPIEHARVESVEIHVLPALGLPPPFSMDTSYCIEVEDAREQGLWIAYALAATLLLRQGMRATEERRWTLAGYLVAPAWAVDAVGCEALARSHPHAPSWLVRLRQRTMPARAAA